MGGRRPATAPLVQAAVGTGIASVLIAFVGAWRGFDASEEAASPSRSPYA
jgi:hypothetical protein